MTESMDASEEPRYWLLVATRETWKHLSVKGEWAFAARAHQVAEHIRNDDLAFVYLKAGSKDDLSALGGLVKFCGNQSRTSGVSLFDQLYPIRIPFEIMHMSNPPTVFRPLVDKLDFIRNYTNWGGAIRGRAARALNKRDYGILLDAMRAEQEAST
jgi:predicted RNA-binding protein